MLRHGAAWLSLGLLVGAAGAASAATCTNIYDTANGATTLPGTFVGTVGGASGVCQIGDLTAANQGNAQVNGTDNPSNYEFYFAGGSLTIEEELGNNGIGNAVDVELEFLERLDGDPGARGIDPDPLFVRSERRIHADQRQILVRQRLCAEQLTGDRRYSRSSVPGEFHRDPIHPRAKSALGSGCLAGRLGGIGSPSQAPDARVTSKRILPGVIRPVSAGDLARAGSIG